MYSRGVAVAAIPYAKSNPKELSSASVRLVREGQCKGSVSQGDVQRKGLTGRVEPSVYRLKRVQRTKGADWRGGGGGGDVIGGHDCLQREEEEYEEG
jgi:hypothetical protein